MRLFVWRNPFRDSRELLVRIGREETVDYEALSWLKESEHGLFLHPRRQLNGERRRLTMRYDVSGCTNLHDYLKEAQPGASWMSKTLVDLAKALCYALDSGNGSYHMSFDPRFVFVDARDRVRLVYLPVNGGSPCDKASPLMLMETLASYCESADVATIGTDLPTRLQGFLLDAQGVFSLSSYRILVEKVTGVRVMPNGDVRHMEEPTKDSYVLRDLTSGNTFSMREGKAVRMGRDATCDVQLLGRPQISRKHATVCVNDGRVTLVDMGSTNGTFVGGRGLFPSLGVNIPLGQVFLLSGDKFRVERG